MGGFGGSFVRGLRGGAAVGFVPAVGLTGSLLGVLVVRPAVRMAVEQRTPRRSESPGET